jgi:hypothetical protein
VYNTLANSVYSLHIGRPLNLWERCSLQSFADQGHEITLYAYGPLDVPEGVKLGDASDIISSKEKDAFFAVAPGLVALFSDLFRYEMLARHGGWWVDTDVVCLGQLPEASFFIGWLGRAVPNAIMAAPKGHPMMIEAANYCRATLHEAISANRFFWGPSNIPGLVARHDLLQNVSALYPIKGPHVWMLGDPAYRADLLARANGSHTIHLFAERFGSSEINRNKLPPSGSYLANLFERHGGAGHPHSELSDWRRWVESLDFSDWRRWAQSLPRVRVRKQPRGWRRLLLSMPFLRAATDKRGR